MNVHFRVLDLTSLAGLVIDSAMRPNLGWSRTAIKGRTCADCLTEQACAYSAGRKVFRRQPVAWRHNGDIDIYFCSNHALARGATTSRGR